MGKVHNLTKSYDCISNVITTPVNVTDFLTNKTISTSAIWDTGATNSVISKSVARTLDLKPISKVAVNGVGGVMVTNVYAVNVTLYQHITVTTKVTECEELSSNNGMLIGMDIINLGDFSVTNFNGKTKMSFRVPSIQDIDFVKDNGKQTPILSTHPPGRNDLCPCGSGIKYKKCCGKNK